MTSKSSSGKSVNGHLPGAPITEEELKEKATAITVNDVLRLRRPTDSKSKTMPEGWSWSFVGYLTQTDENVYKIDFVHFRIRDMNTNAVLFEVERAAGMRKAEDWQGVIFDWIDDYERPASRFVRYHLPSSFLKLKQVGALYVCWTNSRLEEKFFLLFRVDFTVGDRPVQSFRMIECHYFRDQLIKSFDFNFGFCPPNTRNSIEHIYEMPKLDSKQSTIAFSLSRCISRLAFPF